jgi:hypothetical protein
MVRLFAKGRETVPPRLKKGDEEGFSSFASDARASNKLVGYGTMTQRNEQVLRMSTPSGEVEKQVAGSGTGLTADMRLQELNDRVVREARDLAVRIRKEAEIEASRLLENVKIQAGEIIRNSPGQGSILEREDRSYRQTEDPAGTSFLEVLVKIRQELKPSPGESAGKESRIEHVEALPVQDKISHDAPVVNRELAPVCGPDKAACELHSDLTRSLGPLDAAGLDSFPAGRNRISEKLFDEETPLNPKPAPENAELIGGEVCIKVAPPVNVVSFLAILRGLENTRGVRTLGTSGSRSAGSVINISLDSPLPLLHLLEKLPAVDRAKAEDPLVSGLADRARVKSVLITLKKGHAA